jgi:death-on-curing protein
VSEWRWLTTEVILAIHDEQLAEHGGRPGIRDLALLESALARPLNRAAYSAATPFDLAAAYAFGIIRDHPFVDGNKRVAFLAAALFLLEHGWEITATDEAIVMVMLSLAEGTAGEAAFAAWLTQNTTRADSPNA